MASPREQRQEATRERILKAALTLIERDGLHKFSLRALARKVKYSPAGLYEYFDSKDDIVQTLCEIADQKLSDYLSSVSQDLPYQAYMVGMGMAYIRFAREETAYFRLGLVSQMSTHTSLDDRVNEGAYAMLVRGVQQGVDDGFFKVSDDFGTQQIAYTLWAMVHGMATLQTSYLANFDADFASIDEVALHRVIDGLRRR